MGKIRREKTTKSRRKKDEEMIKKARPSKGMNDKNRSLILGKILGQIQRKTIMKWMKNRKKAMMKKFRPSEARSQSMETVMLATEQQQEKYKMLLEILSRLLVKSLLWFMCTNKHWKTVISSHPFRKTMMKKDRPSEVRSQSMETVMPATEQQKENCRILLEDVVMEILSRLPVKSLLRCMCVSKNWKTLISSYPFRKLHREKHASSPPLLIASYYTYLFTFNLHGKILEKIILPLYWSPDICMINLPYQSKLLCFANYRAIMFYLYNPSTRQPFLLTNPSCLSTEFRTHFCGATYGYIQSKDEYIMVHLFKLSNGNLIFEVLKNISISNDNCKLHYNNQWRSIEAPTWLKCTTLPGVFVDGSFYWQALNDLNKDWFILSFDVETDSFSIFGYPRDLLGIPLSWLLQIKGELYLANCPESPPTLVVWKLCSEDNNNKLWSRYWEFDLQRLFGTLNFHNTSFRWRIFIYNLKYLKGYENQPSDKESLEVLTEMGRELLLGLKDNDAQMTCCLWDVEAHDNLFTL